jgi:hypothetical protein
MAEGVKVSTVAHPVTDIHLDPGIRREDRLAAH